MRLSDSRAKKYLFCSVHNLFFGYWYGIVGFNQRDGAHSTHFRSLAFTNEAYMEIVKSVIIHASTYEEYFV